MFFKTAWAIIKPLIDKKTVAKIELTSDTLEKLLSLIDADVLSSKYGGNRDISNIPKPGIPGIPNYVDRSSRLGNLEEVKLVKQKMGRIVKNQQVMIIIIITMIQIIIIITRKKEKRKEKKNTFSF